MNQFGRSIVMVICALGLVFFLASGCGENETTAETVFRGSAGTLVKTSGCKSSGAMSGAAQDLPTDKSCIRYTYNGHGLLSLAHVNAGFNCCPIISADVTIDGNVITIEETETLDHGGCDCLCLYDLDFEIDNLSPGTYTVKVVELYLTEGDEPLVFEINIATTPEGAYCVQRDHYPWGL